MSLSKPTEILKVFPFDEYDRRRKYPRDLPPEFSSTNLTKRIPCIHQGHSSRSFKDEDNPCLICAGRIRKLSGEDIFLCTFEDSRDNNCVFFRDSINLKFITATERFFDIKQQMRREAQD